MPDFIPRPGPDILELVQACGQHLRGIDATAIQKAFHPPHRGSHTPDPTPGQLQLVYDTACRLCDEGNFRFAAALALHLVTHQPGDSRFAFIAATCMQRIGVYGTAAKFYCMTLVCGGDDPSVFYRLAECMLALGDRALAEKALDAAIDLSRHDDGTRGLQAMAVDLLENIKRSSR